MLEKAQDGVEREVVFQLARNKIEILVELVGINDIFRMSMLYMKLPSH